jgi:hypothetical protein
MLRILASICMICYSSFLNISFIPNVLVNLTMDYDDVMLTLSGLPPTFPYGRVDGVQGA